ncbi:MAG: hypothetical protein KC910_38450, partial [Candidatus Eremiobacteraeota bacterium]|nr:hypothetical protein [Candidatus Eremiobacteraeota bacterium]
QRHFTVADGGGVERSEITEQRHVFSFESGVFRQARAGWSRVGTKSDGISFRFCQWKSLPIAMGER